MFSRVHQILAGGLGAVILGLGGWLWWQSSQITSLQAENHAQAQTIEQMNQFNEQLNAQLKAEQQAVISQQKIANELKTKSEQARETVRIIFKDSPCAVAALPDGVIEQLRQQ